MRRITLLVLLLLLPAVASPATAGLARSQPTAQPNAGVRADFNQDGLADLAIGAPSEDVGSISDAGAVTVLYGTASGLSGNDSQLFTQAGGAIETQDFFGSKLASGDFNHDGFAELAAGAPGHNEFAGAVSVLQGSAGGVTDNDWQLFTQDSSGIPGVAEAGDSFGYALTAGSLGPAPATASTPRSGSTERPTTPNR
jgi:hypothetical protein